MGVQEKFNNDAFNEVAEIREKFKNVYVGVDQTILNFFSSYRKAFCDLNEREVEEFKRELVELIEFKKGV
jgi:hypothetical protein